MFPDRSTIQSQGYSQKRQARRPIRTRDAKEGPRLLSSNDPENKRLILIIFLDKLCGFRPAFGFLSITSRTLNTRRPFRSTYSGVTRPRLAPESRSKD